MSSKSLQGSQPNGSAQRHPERTKQRILEEARVEFALHGPAGARVDAITARTNTSKRMIYYYFGSKQGLYQAVLSDAYSRVRSLEVNLHLETVEPELALRTLIRATLTHFEEDLLSVKLFAYENLQQENALEAIGEEILHVNKTALSTLENILSRGRTLGIFSTKEPAPSAIEIHQIISSMALYRIEHQKSFKSIFKKDMLAAEDRERNHSLLEETIMRLVLARSDG